MFRGNNDEEAMKALTCSSALKGTCCVKGEGVQHHWYIIVLISSALEGLVVSRGSSTSLYLFCRYTLS